MSKQLSRENQRLIFIKFKPVKTFSGVRAEPVPVDFRESDVKRVWTLYNETAKAKPPALPFVPVHHHNAFMEDRLHDWNIEAGKLRYGSRVMDRDVWILVELKSALGKRKDPRRQHATKKTAAQRAEVERKIAAEMAAARSPDAPSARDLYLRSLPGTDRTDLPWEHSYANWTVRVGSAAVRHNATIAYGSETYDAWKAGISPDDYARQKAKKR